MPSVFTFEPASKSDVCWIDAEQNEYRVHSIILIHASLVFKDLDWEEKTTIKEAYSAAATLWFLNWCYDRKFIEPNLDIAEECLMLSKKYWLDVQVLEDYMERHGRFLRSDLHSHKHPFFPFTTWTPDGKIVENLSPGDYCQFLDTEDILYMARIVQVNATQYYVHYIGFICKFDEWIDKSDPRLSARGTVDIFCAADLSLGTPHEWEKDDKQDIQQLKVGDWCEYLWDDTNWRKAKVIRVLSNDYVIAISGSTRRPNRVIGKNSEFLCLKGTHKNKNGSCLNRNTNKTHF
jgi:hypothetical protein